MFYKDRLHLCEVAGAVGDYHITFQRYMSTKALCGEKVAPSTHDIDQWKKPETFTLASVFCDECERIAKNSDRVIINLDQLNQ